MKADIWVSSAQANELLAKQQTTWPLIKSNYANLQSIRTKSFDFGDFTIEVQYNPARITSTGAKIDAHSIRERKCFLCAKNLPQEQIRLPFGYNYFVLCNPYPIFSEHFTIPSKLHEPQEIYSRIPDLLELAQRLNQHTLFYNGPRSGASAPDHAHFQAVTRGQMPIEKEIELIINKYGKEVFSFNGCGIYAFTHYLRNGFYIQSKSSAHAQTFFSLIYNILDKKKGDTEPDMNLFCWYEKEYWHLVIIPRHKHRPRQFDATGEEQFISSPGAADMGGLFITPREEDFDKVTADIIRDIYEQVCYSDKEIEKLVSIIVRN